MKGSNVTVCPFVVQESYLRNTYIHTHTPCRYVATVREGGTELTLILDLSQSYDLSTPGWLIQLVYLMHYSLHYL